MGDEKEVITIFLEKKEKWKGGTTGSYKILIRASFGMELGRDLLFPRAEVM